MDGNRSSKIGNSTVIDKYYDRDDYSLETIFTNVERYTELVVVPIIGVVGLVGNALSGVIMVNDGLHKPSNILLLGLAVSDFLLLLHTVNVPHLMMYTTQLHGFWMMDLDLIHVCYRLSMAIQFVSVLTLGMSTSLTVFITLERVVAVYLPLRFPSLVTPKRATFVVILSFCMAMPNAVINQLKYGLYTLYDKETDGWVGMTYLRESWVGSGMEFFARNTNAYIVPIVPTTIVSICCVLIGLKITITMRRRKKLTSRTRERNSSARTRTLFIVSFVFFITRACSLFAFLPQVQFSIALNSANYAMSRLVILVSNLLLLFNSSCNVFIYAIFNPKFRKLINKQLLCASKLKNNK